MITIDLTPSDREHAAALLKQLDAEPVVAAMDYCHEGLHVRRRTGGVELVICSFTACGQTFDAAVACMRAELIRRVNRGELGC